MTANFWRAYTALPGPVKSLAKAAYRQFRRDPQHPSLDFKRIQGTKRPVYSARIAIGYCAIGTMTQGEEVTWHLVGSHPDYDKLIL